MKTPILETDLLSPILATDRRAQAPGARGGGQSLPGMPALAGLTSQDGTPR